jgi:hypothetical protein
MATSQSQCPPLGFSGNYYHLSQGQGGCVRQSSFFDGKPVLNQAVGYSVILGFGAFFTVFTSFLVGIPYLFRIVFFFSVFSVWLTMH